MVFLKTGYHYLIKQKLFLLLGILLSVAFISVPVKAQFSGELGTFTLIQSDKLFNISPFVYKTEDKDGNLLWSDVLKRHINNIRGERIKSDSINLSFQTKPAYLVFSLRNKTQNSDWVLDLGKRTTGRVGLFKSFYFYDASKKTMIADTVSKDADIATLENKLIGPGIPFKLKPGKSALFLLYVQPDNGIPFTLPLRITSQNQYAKNLLETNNLHNVVIAFCVIGIAFFFGIFLLRQRLEYILFGLFFVVLTNMFTHMNTHFLSLHPLDNVTFSFWLNIGAFLSLFINSSFLEFRRNNETTSSSLTYILGFFALTSIAVLWFFFPIGHPSRPIFFVGVPTFILIFVTINSFTKSVKGRAGASFLAFGWLTMLIGTFSGQLSYLNIIDPAHIAHLGIWLSIIPFCIFSIIGSAIRFRLLESQLHETASKRSGEADSLVRIQRSKEAADQQRLLRVIEREREVMEELREREAKRTEEMRKAKEAADEANSAKSAFLAIISHEIRTPMTGILGMVRLMLQTQLTKDQTDYAITIQESGETMLALLNDILDFEKIESGKMDIEEVSFDLKRMIKSVITLMSGHAREKKITLDSQIMNKIPTYVVGDPTRIRQVLLNLVGNAIKFTSRGGVKLIVRAHEVSEKGGDPESCDIYFGIKDTGIGISEEQQKNLFNPFSQADSSISRKFGGTGLGLAICKALITAMGSQINLSSKENEGSTFSFTLRLPVSKHDQTTEEAPIRPSPVSLDDQEKNQILLCEDNEINQRVIIGFLEHEGHEITIAEDGLEAVAKASGETKFDLILMDIEMPGQNGLQASIQIREEDGINKDTPIVALSGNVSAEAKKRCFNSGMNDHLEKPINPNALNRIIGAIKTNDFLHPESKIVKEETTEPEKKKTPDTIEVEDVLDNADDLSSDEGEDIFEDSFAQSIEAHTAKDTSETGEQDVFDKAMLQSLKDSLPAEQINELLDGLFVKADEIIISLEMAANENDIDEIVARAHELKGMTGNFGLSQISSMAARMEEDARSEVSDADYPGRVAKLPNALKNAKKAIEEWQES